MKKMQEKSKIYNIQGKSTNSPSNQAIWMANTNFPPQISKLRRIKEFGENVGQQSLGVYISHLNVPLLYMISQKVVSPLNTSHLFVEDWFFGFWDDTGVITHEDNSLKPHSKISHSMHYSKNLWAAASSSYILGLGGRLCNWTLFPRRPANERRFKKMVSTRRALSVNLTTRKISIGKTNKIQWRRSRILNPKLRSVFEIPENSLDRRPM
jgi:hypothetical protein